MKKVSIITVLLMLASVPSVMWADEILLDNVNVEPKGTTPLPIITAPKWDEFCEPGYENAVYTDKNDVFNYIIFVKTERDKRNYWAGRRESFEKYLNHCKTIVDDTDRGVCYTDLRRLENDKNEVYSSKKNQILYQNDAIIKDSTK